LSDWTGTSGAAAAAGVAGWWAGGCWDAAAARGRLRKQESQKAVRLRMVDTSFVVLSRERTRGGGG
jgi:hypothetical protein